MKLFRKAEPTHIQELRQAIAENDAERLKIERYANADGQIKAELQAARVRFIENPLNDEAAAAFIEAGRRIKDIPRHGELYTLGIGVMEGRAVKRTLKPLTAALHSYQREINSQIERLQKQDAEQAEALGVEAAESPLIAKLREANERASGFLHDIAGGHMDPTKMRAATAFCLGE